MRNGHVAMRGQVLLTKSSNLVWEGRRKERESKRREIEKERVLEREVHLLSKFPGDRTVGFRRGKEQSYSPWQGLHVGTSFGEFRQTPKR